MTVIRDISTPPCPGHSNRQVFSVLRDDIPPFTDVDYTWRCPVCRGTWRVTGIPDSLIATQRRQPSRRRILKATRA